MVEGMVRDVDAARADAELARPYPIPVYAPGWAAELKWDGSPDTQREATGVWGAFFGVHMTMCDPFQVKSIGTLRGAPSLAT
jgi:hypothetical protein